MPRPKHLPHTLLNAATALSLATCIAALAWWPRTLRSCDAATLFAPALGTSCAVSTTPHGVEVILMTRLRTFPDDQTPPAGLSFSSVRWGTRETLNSTTRIPATLASPDDDDDNGDDPDSSAEIIVGTATAILHGFVPPAHQRLGFGWDAQDIPPTPRAGTAFTTSIQALPAWRYRRVMVPLWFVAAASLLLPLSRCAARYRRYLLQRRAGLCPNCAYDLRATPDRCPECGTLIETHITPYPTTSPPDSGAHP